ncbi:AAA domain-containing protein, partial [Haematococcus lacustris]
FLKDPKAFNRLGARPPKGILLEGDPGTGKTLLAKALAGEAMVPFYQMAGTEFTEGIVGVGAARVRDLFKRARANAPCIIFVDELDALGLKRAEGDGTGKVNEEREQTLNQLLTEMDGFTPDIGVVFMGATNRADLLDPALMRPGRFDRKVRMPKPDTEGRFDILQLHLRKKKIAPDVDLMQLSRDLPGLVGADLANIVNEAQLTAVRAGRTEITARDMYAGVDRFTQGELRPPIPTTNKLPITVFAAKEAGIALVADLLYKKHKRIEELERVSIQPKGRSYSRTLFARGSDEDYQLMTRGRLLDRIRVALAGHIAVRVVIGQETNFSVPDLQRASDMAHKYVFYYAMSDLGITTWAKAPYSSDFSVGLKRPRKVRMPKPDTEGRFDILQLHLRKKKIAPDVDLMQLSRDLPGLVGADLANIVNEAQLTAVRAGRTEITARDMYAGVDRFTQGELRPPIPTTNKLPITVFAAKEAGIALVADLLYMKHKRIEELERVSIQPKGRSYSRTLFARGSDEDYQLMTRGRLLDRIRVALAGHIAVRVVIGQETNFSVPDLQRASDMAHKYVFYYAMSDLGITTWAKAPYSSDFSVGLKRPRKVVSTDAMDGYADWPTRNEDFRFDPLDPSDPTWHRYSDEVRKLIKTCYDEVPEADEKLPSLDSMVIFTNSAKGTDKWPFGIEWLKDAYPTPYWLEEDMAEVSMERHGRAKQLVVFFGAASIGTGAKRSKPAAEPIKGKGKGKAAKAKPAS